MFCTYLFNKTIYPLRRIGFHRSIEMFFVHRIDTGPVFCSKIPLTVSMCRKPLATHPRFLFHRDRGDHFKVVGLKNVANTKRH